MNFPVSKVAKVGRRLGGPRVVNVEVFRWRRVWEFELEMERVSWEKELCPVLRAVAPPEQRETLTHHADQKREKSVHLKHLKGQTDSNI